MLAGQVEQGGGGLFQRLAAAGDARLQQASFVEGDEQGSQALRLRVGMALQLLLQRLADGDEGVGQGRADFVILRAAFQGDGGQRAAAFEGAFLQLAECAVQPGGPSSKPC